MIRLPRFDRLRERFLQREKQTASINEKREGNGANRGKSKSGVVQIALADDAAILHDAKPNATPLIIRARCGVEVYKVLPGDKITFSEYGSTPSQKCGEWSGIYTQFQRNHVLGTIPYRWDKKCTSARLVKVTFQEELQVVMLNEPVFFDNTISGDVKACIVKESLGIDQRRLLMNTLGLQGRVCLVRETDCEWELVIPHTLFERLSVRETEIARFLRHPELPITAKWTPHGRDETEQWDDECRPTNVCAVIPDLSTEWITKDEIASMTHHVDAQSTIKWVDRETRRIETTIALYRSRMATIDAETAHIMLESRRRWMADERGSDEIEETCDNEVARDPKIPLEQMNGISKAYTGMARAVRSRVALLERQRHRRNRKRREALYRLVRRNAMEPMTSLFVRWKQFSQSCTRRQRWLRLRASRASRPNILLFERVRRDVIRTKGRYGYASCVHKYRLKHWVFREWVGAMCGA